MYAEQREVAKAKNQEQRIKANERKKLEEEEKVLKKKESILENGSSPKIVFNISLLRRRSI